MTYLALLAELEVAVKAGSLEKREETLRLITGLFLNESDRLNEQQISVFGDVLGHLMQKVETKALVELSQCLAPVNNAPTRIVRRLSFHDKIAIAEPMLARSKQLTEKDLIKIAKSKGRHHLLAMSGRNSLTEEITDVLIERGDKKVCHALARNSDAKFSKHGFAALVEMSDRDEVLAIKLGLRLDLPFELLRRLLARASHFVRSQLLATSSPENLGQIQSALTSIACEPNSVEFQASDFRRADGIVHDLNRRGQLTEAALVDFIKARTYEEVTVTLALFARAEPALIESVLKNANHSEIIVACKAANVTWPTVALILKDRAASILPHELDAAKDAFLELPRTAAQEFLRAYPESS